MQHYKAGLEAERQALKYLPYVSTEVSRKLAKVGACGHVGMIQHCCCCSMSVCACIMSSFEGGWSIRGFVGGRAGVCHVFLLSSARCLLQELTKKFAKAPVTAPPNKL